MSDPEILFFDLVEFIKRSSSWVTKESPLQIRTYQRKLTREDDPNKWGVLLTVRREGKTRMAVKHVPTPMAASKLAEQLRDNFTQSLVHVVVTS